MSESELIAASEVLLESLGFADPNVLQFFLACREKVKDNYEYLAQLLHEELEIDLDDAINISTSFKNRVIALNNIVDIDEAISDSQKETVSAPEESDEKREPEAKKAKTESINSIQSVLNDSFLAAKAGRFEQLKDDPVYMSQLREEARRTYLRKRELEQFEVAQKVLADREWLFKSADINITDIEKRDIELQKETISIAKSLHEERKQKGSVAVYEIPENYDENTEARLAVLKDKWKETEFTQSATWDSTALSDAAGLETASAITKEKSAIANPKTYKIIDETGAEIDFVCGEDLPGFIDMEQSENNLSRAEREKKTKESREAKAKSLMIERQKLPVFEYRKNLLKAIQKYPVLIIVGETGCGKTTQIPQYLNEVGYAKLGKIGCTQPRRVAAMSVAARVANEMGVRLGHEVGYSIRFEDCTTDRTVIKYMTDGMLLREFMSEPDLSTYSVIMIDEAHERTLHTDVLFGLVKDLSRHRVNDFRLIISSATLEAEQFATYFDNAPIFKIPGRRHPVQIYYTKAPEANFLDAAVVTVLQIHLSQPLDSGDILVFLPGQQEIEEMQEELERRIRGRGTEIGELQILPLYSTLPSDLQAKIFEETQPNVRKVVLATNIAETSITIDNIVYVIDPGFVKQNTYNPKSSMESLVIVPCSKAAVNQRAGRAGRVRPGKCFRLYTKTSYEKEMDDSNVPEILRSNLGNVVLSLKSLGIDNLLNFDFMNPPPPSSLIKSLELLYALSALNDKGDLTRLGRRMAEFPLDPMYSKMIVNAETFNCVSECITIAAMLSVGNSIFYRPKDKQMHADNARKNFFRPGGDQLALLNVYNQWEETEFSLPWCYENFIQYRSMRRARDVREQLIDMLERVEVELSSSGEDSELIRKAITAGFFSNSARLNKNGAYSTLKYSHTVDIHPQSSLFVSPSSDQNGQKKSVNIAAKARLVVYAELVLTTKEYMRNVIEIEPKWLLELAPHFFDAKEILKEHQFLKVPKQKS